MSSVTTTVPVPSLPERRRSLARRFTLLEARELAIQGVLATCALLSIFTTLGIIAVLAEETFEFFKTAGLVEFFTDTRWTPQFQDKHYGILPLLSGTVMVAGIASLIGIPLGLASALYLSEYATPRTRSIIKPTLEILAGVPTVVYGFFALAFVTPFVIRPIFQGLLGFEVDVFNAASAGVAVGIMIIPTIASLSEDVLRAVPRSLREGAYALGSTKFDVCVRVVLPAALSGILASFLLAISRAVGETMAVTIAAGQNPRLTFNPFRSTETMTAYIVNVSLGDTPAGTIEYSSLYAVAATLFAMTLATNILAQFILRRYREVYQ
jgi:phosphate transport system permease protein